MHQYHVDPRVLLDGALSIRSDGPLAAAMLPIYRFGSHVPVRWS